MIAGHLREKNGKYCMVLDYRDEYGNRKIKTKSTGLPIKGNKKKAEAMLQEARANFQLPTQKEEEKNLLFTDYLLEWLEMVKLKIELSTYSSYSMVIKRRLIPYFEPKNLLLTEVTNRHIQEYYNYCINEEGVSGNTVLRRHANLHMAFKHAVRTDLILKNPTEYVEKPKKRKYRGEIYDKDELDHLFSLVQGHRIEFAVKMASYYGLRRSEIVGLKWSAFDFKKKVFKIGHTVTQFTLDDKVIVVEKDRGKTEDSIRSLPLIQPVEDMLLRMKKEQERYQYLCGDSYNQDFLEYVYVNEIGERVKPAYITDHFKTSVIRKNKLKDIRFHDLRHSCASLLFQCGIPLKEIQEWLGHSDIGTTANIYTHLNFEGKQNSANAILDAFGG